MHTLSPHAEAYEMPDSRGLRGTPWVALAGVAAALALVAWAGPEHGTVAAAAPALECRISHPAGTGHITTVMLVNASPHTLPAGTAWGWAPAGGDPEHGEHRVLTEPLAGGSAVRVWSDVPAVALRCRAALSAAASSPAG